MAASMAMILIYVLNIYKIVRVMVAVRTIETKITSTTDTVQDLDAEYLQISGKITPDSLHSHGFLPAEVSEYISKSASLSRSPASSGHEL